MKLRAQNYKKMFIFAGYFSKYDENEIFIHFFNLIFNFMLF